MARPWHLYLVGVLSLLWNGFGAADYALTKLSVTAYVANMPPEMRAALDAYPVWMTAVWALAVWLPVLAALLLLSGRGAAAVLYGIGLVLVLVAGAWNYLIAQPSLNQIAGDMVLYFWIAVVVIAVLQWLYARAMRQRGVLE